MNLSAMSEVGIQASAVRGRDLEREIARAERRWRWAKALLAFAIFAVLAASIVFWRVRANAAPPPRYILQPTTSGDVIETVQSTGTVEPLTQVNVGAQVSGRIVRVLVDFNSEVKKGDLVAEIDPTLLGAQVAQNDAQMKASHAAVARAESDLRTAKVELDRVKRLFAEGLASQSDMVAAQGKFDGLEAELASAKAAISQIQAQLVYSRTNLAYARIYAPIDGVVISRNVDPGQTVAANFQAPTLFVIAQDLRKMRIMAQIDESDVGKLAEGMNAEATVDAFPGQPFAGRVVQVRFSPTTDQGVVTYAAVIDVDNPEKKLRPGMTATVTITTNQAKKVVKLPNSALRFKPTPAAQEEGKPPPVAAPPKALPHGKGRIYVLANATPGKEELAEKIIDVGITDGIHTEVKNGAIPEGAEVVVDETDAVLKEKKPGGRRGMF